MAVEKNDVVKLSKAANADLSAQQFKFVKLVTGGKIDVCSAVTDVPCGVLQNKPKAGQTAEVTVIGLSKILVSAAIGTGVEIGTANDGRAAAYVPGTDTTKYICGQMVDASTGANDIADALIDCAAPHRAS